MKELSDSIWYMFFHLWMWGNVGWYLICHGLAKMFNTSHDHVVDIIKPYGFY